MMNPSEETESTTMTAATSSTTYARSSTPSHPIVIVEDEEEGVPVDVFDDEYRIQNNNNNHGMMKDVDLSSQSNFKDFSGKAQGWNHHHGYYDSNTHPRNGSTFLHTAWQAVQEGMLRVTTVLRRHDKAQKGCIAGVIVVVALIVLISVGHRGRGRRHATLTRSEVQYQAILQTLSQVTPVDILTNPTTVYHQALQWILDENDYNSNGQEDDDDDDNDEKGDSASSDKTMFEYTDGFTLMQRYAVVVLDRALGAGVAQPKIPTCDWEGIDCTTDHPIPAVTAVKWANQGLTGTLPNNGIWSKALQPHLLELDLGENDIQGTLPDGLLDCIFLQKLYLHQNQFNGTLSNRFANLRHLTHLYLGQNQFQGTFPVGLGTPPDSSSARPLKYLNLHDNQLTGTIPANLHYRFLYYLDLSQNQFRGTLPADWAEGPTAMLQLRHLFLYDNEFSGTIPASYPNGLGHGRLETFHAGHNQLTGTVPGNYNQPAKFIESLELHHNNFTALAPDICDLIIFVPPATELANLKLDCNVCNCSYWCEPGYCY